MLKPEKEKEIEQLAKKIQRQDRRLSWGSCLKKAKASARLFNQ